MTTRVFLATTCALAACAYSADFNDCAVRCSANAECPAGLECGTEGLCRIPGETAAAETCARVLETSPSCAGLAPTCGPSGDEDCCSTTTPIPGGTFFRSYDVAVDGIYPSTAYPATVSAFSLDRFEVTVGRFRKFVEAGRGTRMNPPPAGAGARFLNGTENQGGWDASWNAALAADSSALVAILKCDATYQAWTDVPGPNEELPINCVTWYEAFAFCAWDGGSLPTEAEWNFAAAGGDEQRAYPWSNPASATTIDCSYANYSPGTPPETRCVDSLNRVGSESPKGDSKWNAADIGGNVWEYTLDTYESPYNNPCDNCTNLASAPPKAIRGGDFYFGLEVARSAYRGNVESSGRFFNGGVRCIRASF